MKHLLMLQDLGLLILRVGASTLMLSLHGKAKLWGFREMAENFGDPIGLGPTTSLVLAIVAEFFCAILVALGLVTRIAAIPLVITMAVALFVVHGADPWARRELACVYLLIFTSILLAGPGRISLDHLIWRRRETKKAK